MLRCKLLLSQDNNSLEITLDRMIEGSYYDVFTQWGKFSSSQGNIPPERKLWVHALAKWELKLMDGGGPGIGSVGGGLNFGELAALSPSAILSHATMTSRGVEPLDPSDVGVGTILNGFEISVYFHRGQMSWRLLSFQESGSNAWKSP
jgi:hypothetical protein